MKALQEIFSTRTCIALSHYLSWGAANDVGRGRHPCVRNAPGLRCSTAVERARRFRVSIGLVISASDRMYFAAVGLVA
jgi:hypothetical protein